MRMVSRKIPILMLLIALLMVIGCNKTEQTNPGEGQESSNIPFGTAPVNTTLIQGTPSGVLFMLSNGIAECLNKTYPGSVLNITPGNPSSNVFRLFNGDAEFIMTFNTSSLAVLEAHPELKGIAALKTSPFQFVLEKDIDAVTFDDIIAKKLKVKLSIGLKDSVNELAFKQILKEYNVTIDDMQDWGCVFVNKNPDDTGTMFTDGAIDGYFWGMGAPHPTIMKNALDKPIKFITIDPKVIDAVCSAYGYKKIAVPVGTYDFQSEDYNTFTDYMILATTDNCSNETAYKMTRAIHQNTDYITMIHDNFKDLNGEKMVNELRIPLHPGALQYYQEVGLVN